MEAKRRKRLAAVALAGAALALLLFSTADTCEQYCFTCSSDLRYTEYRVLGIRVYRAVFFEQESFVARVAADLGSPCVHDWPIMVNGRRVAFVFPIRGTRQLTLMEGRAKYRYTERFSESVKRLGADNPAIAEEFHRRVLVEKDWAFVDELVDKLRSQLGPEELGE